MRGWKCNFPNKRQTGRIPTMRKSCARESFTKVIRFERREFYTYLRNSKFLLLER